MARKDPASQPLRVMVIEIFQRQELAFVAIIDQSDSALDAEVALTCGRGSRITILSGSPPITI